MSSNPLIATKPGQRDRMWPALQAMLENFNLRNENLLPCSVVSYDRTNNIVTVQPLVQLVKTDGTTISRAQYAKIPALALGGGGFFINFPIKAGDLGWILASDRDLSLFNQSLAMSAPSSTRCHKFEDGWFIPDVFRNYSINSTDASNNAMVISSVDSNTRIAIWDGNVAITAPTKVLVDTPLAEFTHNVQIDGNLDVKGTALVEMTLTVTQLATFNGGFNMTGTGAVSGDITINSLSVINHFHVAQGATAPTTVMQG